MLISILLVCAYGCGNEDLEDRIKGLENENENLGSELQKLNTDMKSSSEVIEDINALVKNIQETEDKIEERKHRLRSAKEVENAVEIKDEILNSIQGLYDDLKRHREKAVVLQGELDSLVATNAQQNESIALFKNVIQEKTIKIEGLVKNVDSLKKHVIRLENKQEELTNNISDLKSELYVKENEALRKELKIESLNEKMNTIFYIIGNSNELREKKIIVKKGVPLFSRHYVLGEYFTLDEFKQGKSSLTEFRIDGKIKKILPYRSKDHYYISYENGESFMIIKDPKNFWHQKYLVIVTK